MLVWNLSISLEENAYQTDTETLLKKHEETRNQYNPYHKRDTVNEIRCNLYKPEDIKLN